MPSQLCYLFSLFLNSLYSKFSEMPEKEPFCPLLPAQELISNSSRNNSLPAKRPKVALACMEYRKKADEGYNATTSYTAMKLKRFSVLGKFLVHNVY
jgi:hypothetical protein